MFALKSRCILAVSLVMLFQFGCDQNAPQVDDHLFQLMSGDSIGIDFTNQVKESAEFNVLTYRNFYNGGGVAIGDLNGDQLPEIYFTANTAPNKLFLNKGNWQFQDITLATGVGGTKAWSTGVSFADVNADGLLDIYVCNSGDIEGSDKENELFINLGPNQEGIPLFEEKAAEYGLNDEGFSTHASFFDYDKDGDLDCYILNNSFKDPSNIDLFRKTREQPDLMGGDRLLRNDGDQFSDQTNAAGIYNSAIGFGLGVSVSDVDGDHWPDIYISNDFWERDYLYINQKDGTFEEQLPERIGHTSISSMGADLADINNDGSLEIFSTDMLAADNYRLKSMTAFDPYQLEDIKYRGDYHFQILQNCLQLNDGQGEFQEIGFLSGIAATDWSWGALIFDFDNDGWKDIYVANGIYHDIMYMDFTTFIQDELAVKEIVTNKGRFDFRDFLPYLPSNPLSNYAFVNQRNLKFENQAQALGLASPSFSNGAAYGDLDRDGDYDLVVNNVNMPCFVYQNKTEQEGNHYLGISFKGPGDNPFGIGAKVQIESQSGTQILYHYTARGFESSMENGLLFGLGKDKVIDRLEVQWPDFKIQNLENISTNQHLVLDYSAAFHQSSKTPKEEKTTLFVQRQYPFLDSAAKHTENLYNDFSHERLLPHMLSTEGPKILVGDVNGDEIEDFVLLSAKHDIDKVFTQNESGHFQRLLQPGFTSDSLFESSSGLLFDPDLDGDLDLLLAAGGNEYQDGIESFLLRYYQNDGQGQFQLRPDLCPVAGGHISCLKAADFDKDGDPDLFMGGRAVPGHYGLTPSSFLFRNDDGNWTNITPPYIGGAGMVTDAAWVDVNRDQKEDLIVIGEWMPISIYLNNGTSLEAPQIIENSEGWWNCMKAADLDGDGLTDFVLGNWGLNSKFRASPAQPLEIYIKDFDQNGKTEFILNWFTAMDDQAYPFATKSDLTAQMPHLKNRILKYEEYAHMQYEDLLTEAERNKAQYRKSKVLANSILWQTETGFRIESLPFEAQIAPTFGILTEDLNGDGKTDIILGGNLYEVKPEVGRFDAHKGICLINQGNRAFKPMSYQESGLKLQNQVRDIQSIQHAAGHKAILVGRNNESTMLFEPNILDK